MNLDIKRGEYQRNFQSLCRAFFYQDASQGYDLQVVGLFLALFDRAYKNPVDQCISLNVDDSSVIPIEFSGIPLRTYVPFTTVLDITGFDTTPDRFGSLKHKEDYMNYQQAKNAIRSQYHREKGIERAERFHILLSEIVQTVDNTDQVNVSSFNEHEFVKRTKRAFSFYLVKYGSDLAAYPILLGYQKLLRVQISNPNRLAYWELERYSFTEGGNDDFVKDTLTLLLEVGCSPNVLPTTSQSLLRHGTTFTLKLGSIISVNALIRLEIDMCLGRWYRQALYSSRPTGTITTSEAISSRTRSFSTYIWQFIYKVFHLFIR